MNAAPPQIVVFCDGPDRAGRRHAEYRFTFYRGADGGWTTGRPSDIAGGTADGTDPGRRLYLSPDRSRGGYHPEHTGEPEDAHELVLLWCRVCRTGLRNGVAAGKLDRYLDALEAPGVSRISLAALAASVRTRRPPAGG